MSIRESEARALASTSAPAPVGPVHHRKIAKAPNPLSIKKKKSIPVVPGTTKEPLKTKTSSVDSLKRGRDADGFGGESQDDGNALLEDKIDHSSNAGSGHKRKRRRKGTQA